MLSPSRASENDWALAPLLPSWESSSILWAISERRRRTQTQWVWSGAPSFFYPQGTFFKNCQNVFGQRKLYFPSGVLCGAVGFRVQSPGISVLIEQGQPSFLPPHKTTSVSAVTVNISLHLAQLHLFPLTGVAPQSPPPLTACTPTPTWGLYPRKPALP